MPDGEDFYQFLQEEAEEDNIDKQTQDTASKLLNLEAIDSEEEPFILDPIAFKKKYDMDGKEAMELQEATDKEEQ